MRILVVSDTHYRSWPELHPAIHQAVQEVDLTVHCGDYTNQDVVEGFRREARRFIGVHGNSDPPDLRRTLPVQEVLRINGHRVGITHPAWGGPPFEPEELLPDFPEGVDVILFGHLHEPMNTTRQGVLFVNPGQGYASFLVPATIALLTIEPQGVQVEIRTIEPGR